MTIQNELVRSPSNYSIRKLSEEIYQRNKLLYRVGAFHIGLFFLTIIASQIDTRVVTGVNVWIKPMKFMLSIAIYLWTIAWFTDYFPRSGRSIKIITWGSAIAMIAETVCIIGQAARGTTSHYNQETMFDGIIFGIMGQMILINALLIVYMLILTFTQPIDRDRLLIWGLRLGICVFLLGNADGVIMVEQAAHTVGAPDGGPGLPVLNWSTIAGDLRIAHMLGLHAIQFIPLISFLIGKFLHTKPFLFQVSCLSIITILYTSMMILTFIQAMQGHPLINI